MSKAKTYITTVLQQESKARSQHVHEIKRESKIDAHSAAIRTVSTGATRDEDLEDEMLERLWESLLNHPDSNQLEPGIVQLLIDQARATVLMKRSASYKIRFDLFLFKKRFKRRKVLNLRHLAELSIESWHTFQSCQQSPRKVYSRFDSG